MSKRILAVLLSVVLFALSVFTACADDRFTIDEMTKCRKVYSYSGSSHAYFYGYSNTTLYSARVLPDAVTRFVTIDGVIRAACHDETYACALFEQRGNNYKIIKMNMNTGECIQYDVPFKEELVYTSVACAGGEAVVIINSTPYARAAGFSNGKTYRYAFSANTDSVFVNGGKLYTLTDNGDIYLISKGDKKFCKHISPGAKFVNSGSGYLCSERGELVSLDGGADIGRGSYAVKTDSGFYDYPAGAQSVAVLKDKAAVLKKGGSCEIVSLAVEEEKAVVDNAKDETGKKLEIGKIAVFDAGVTVSQLKSSYSNIVGVVNTNGKAVSSGSLKTGYSVELTQGSCRIAVRGDVNGKGNVNSADVSLLMNYLVGSEKLSDCKLCAADLNNDGSADNLDLVLLAKMAE